MHVSLALSTIVLLFCAQSAFSSRVVKRSEDLRQQVLGELNEFRSKYAEAAQVSNMNELTYDMELEKVASQYNSCHDENILNRLENEPHYALRKKQLEDDFVEYAAIHRNETEKLKGYFRNEDLFSTVLQPNVKKVGCYHFTSLCVHNIWPPAAIFTNVKRSTVRGWCIFGPKHRFTPDDTFYGKPGSHCSGKLTRNGLCKATN
ncbi:hypothetical protein GCK72_012531 [Caenorhabditis remanei]|uniref:SCP domain-containing protein n=1 Tax=Caenorhabditis remanei TaxID=31234 RepID=A0A6A5GL66_CAERE|nr:hypothetical protein GCK72_012531 [Caenorhabditis remanei]KAF1756078.1 hypothetical protein GCK72_012531 [Caenorhabditis remanei]